MQIRGKLELVVRRELLEATFLFYRLALFCYLAAVGLFFYMVAQDTNKIDIRFFFACYVGFGFLNFAFAFVAERIIKSIHIRKIGLLGLVAVMFCLQGFAFREILPLVADEKIRLVSYCLMVGVTGAAGFVFSADKHIFPAIALGWNLPIMQFMIFTSRTLPDVILTLMLGVYLIAMIYVQTQEYKRRVELIRTRLEILKEKTATMAAKNLAHKTLEKQHGDYFLLRLLLEPLLKFQIPKSTVSVNTYLQQHKTFPFKGKTHSLGGDYIYVDELILAGEKYIFATNADAMGKSLQGASGAIVYGVLINTLIQRTKLRDSESAKSPERWLKEAYSEIDTVFQTFGGAMIVSAILMLIHESGTVFHLNAEHPSLVLYRAGKAIQFSSENQVFKLGTGVSIDDFAIQVFKLKKNDYLILASDGRDDILIADAQKKRAVMNHTEDIFGESLEAAEGDLGKCIELMGQRGRFSDDLSIIMIHIPENAEQTKSEKLSELADAALATSPEAVAEFISEYAVQITDDEKLITRVMNFFIQEKAYTLGCELSQTLLKASPYSNRLLYFASYLARKAGRYSEAAEFGERLRYRAPKHLPNLLNACYTYLKAGNQKRARFMYERAAALDPEHRHTKILAGALGLSQGMVVPAVA